MTITEQDRRNLFNGLEEAIGTEPANKLMELLPHQPADQLVTRTDMHAFGSELRGEMAELRSELRGEMSELRSELRADMAELRADIVDRFATAKIETQRLILVSMAGNTVAVVAALLT